MVRLCLTSRFNAHMRIQTKVFLTILLSSIALALGMTQLVQWSIDQGLVEYSNQKQAAEYQPIAEALVDYYERDGNWGNLGGRRFDDLVREFRPEDPRPRHEPPPRRRDGRPPRRQGRGDNPRRPPPPGRPDDRPPPQPLTLLDTTSGHIAGARRNIEDLEKIKLMSNGELIGFLAFPGNERLADDFELQFVEQQRESLIVVSLVVIALAAVSAFLFAPTIVKPIKRIAASSHELTNGNYSIVLDENRSDEIGDLSKDINQLTRTLEKNETLRQRWLADTSHELRTPLAIIKGEIEAMLDGVRPIGRDQLASLAQEVNQLHKLINDLTDLSNADIGGLRFRKQMLDLNDLVSDKAQRIETLCTDAGLTLQYNPGSDEINIWADELRMNQMLDNLIANCCKYTDSPGEVRISINREKTSASLVIEDSGPGVPEESIPRLFDYLYRVESSRNRKTGGSGLGLAIAARIVEGHDGTIAANPSQLGGLAITVHIPLMANENV